jgi:hypothetical protein
MPLHILCIRSTVPDAAERPAFDAWYSREHLPDAAKSFGALHAWRYWLANDASVHLAMYEFPDRASLDAANDGEEIKRLVKDFDRDWPDVKRTREILVLAEEWQAQ